MKHVGWMMSCEVPQVAVGQVTEQNWFVPVTHKNTCVSEKKAMRAFSATENRWEWGSGGLIFFLLL